MDDSTPNFWNYQTNYIKTSYNNIVDLFRIIFKLELEDNTSEVFAKFQLVSIVRFREFRAEMRMDFLVEMRGFLKNHSLEFHKI